jgi:hypothetical protein
MTAVTPLRRPDELNDRYHAAGGQNAWPGRAVDPGDTDTVIGRSRPRYPDPLPAGLSLQHRPDVWSWSHDPLAPRPA